MGRGGGAVVGVVRRNPVIDSARRLLSTRFMRDTLALQMGKIVATILSFISSLLVWRLLGPEGSGVFAWAASLVSMAQLLDLTGLGTSTGSRLAVAIGAKQDDEVRDLLAFHLQTNVVVNVILIAGMFWVGRALATTFYGNPTVGDLAAGLALGLLADGVYNLILTALQARRSMLLIAIVGVVNQLVLSVCVIGALLIQADAAALVVARLAYAYVTLALAVILYARVRGQGENPLPGIGVILSRIGRVSARPYWRFGVANAVDKNLAELSVQIPIQIVGIIGGERAVGFLTLAMTGITNVGILTSALFENLKTVVPQAVGRRDFAQLWRGIPRAMIALAVGGAVVYGALALVAPFAIPPILGAEWDAAIPSLIALTPFGVITAVAGVLGPVYRALDLMRGAIFAKSASLLLVLVPGSLLLVAAVGSDPASPEGTAAVGGALLLDAVFVVAALLTARATLPPLRRLAQDAANPPFVKEEP